MLFIVMSVTGKDTISKPFPAAQTETRSRNHASSILYSEYQIK